MNTVDILAQALEFAVEGEARDLERFFSELLSAKLIIPKRFQQLPLSDSPEYPDEFLDILGVKDKDRVVVPVFSREELVRDWSGTEFAVREMGLSELLKLIPDEWWVTINPGTEIEKELSPWELSELKGGKDAIPMLVAESQAFAAETGMSFVVPSQEFLALQAALTTFAKSHEDIDELFLLQQNREDASALPALAVGVRTAQLLQAESEMLRTEVLAVAERAVIGAATVQVIMGGMLGSTMLDGVFKSFTPFYTKARRGMVGRILGALTTKRSKV